ncbi:AAA family ATPase [Pandoraea sputorum]|uniref:ATP-dependent nuclease n=1 Tax=Pandoraea sputorum TaxID=93222 RepID=UPI001E426F77|nr:AAA family ATPase [Pandoraea sputorum]MCE4059105.1 AAA family ATPase [Pandoraea sputorum]
MKVEKIRVKNFKKVVDLTLDIGDITYLVGGNNSGKSSVLQGIHMGVGCAQASAELRQQVIAESNLRYCPTADFQSLGNDGPYENNVGGRRGSIEFFGKTSDNADASYKVEIYKARNHHNVGVDRSGVYPSFGSFICDYASLFTVYVPGLAGIPHYEEMQSYASVFKKAAGGDANLVFRNIVRLINDRNHLDELENLLFDVIGPCKFKVKFDDSRDLYVQVSISLQDGFADDTFVPIDLCGTGVLQITQIFSYVVLFRPRLLLIDEPDSHLHPSRQSLLSAAFAKISEKYNCKVIVSTHSRHLVSSAPEDTKLIWLRNGSIELQDELNLTSILMDLGALDQIDARGADILVCTEDKGKKALEFCIQSLNLPLDIKVISYNGVTNAASAAVIKNMSELLAKQPRIIIHRDRDFLTDREIEIWGRDFTNRQMLVFSPSLPDVESYFVSPQHIALSYNAPLDEVSGKLTEIRQEKSDALRRKFVDKRRDANLKFWRDGGGPATDALWPPESPPTELTTLGKEIVSTLNDRLPQAYGRRVDLFGRASTGLAQEFLEFIRATDLLAELPQPA